MGNNLDSTIDTGQSTQASCEEVAKKTPTAAAPRPSSAERIAKGIMLIRRLISQGRIQITPLPSFAKSSRAADSGKVAPYLRNSKSSDLGDGLVLRRFRPRYRSPT